MLTREQRLDLRILMEWMENTADMRRNRCNNPRRSGRWMRSREVSGRFYCGICGRQASSMEVGCHPLVGDRMRVSASKKLIDILEEEQ